MQLEKGLSPRSAQRRAIEKARNNPGKYHDFRGLKYNKKTGRVELT